MGRISYVERAKAALASGARSAANAVQSAKPAPQDVRAQRLAICNACPHLTAMRRCGKCGCPVDGKTFFHGARCPIGKW